MTASHTFTTSAPTFPLHAVPPVEYEWDEIWREEQKLSAMSNAWDAMCASALDFDTDAYDRAKASWARAAIAASGV